MLPCPPPTPAAAGTCVDCSFTLSIYAWAAQTGGALGRSRYPADTAAIAVFDDIAARIAPFPIDGATGSWEVAAGLPFAVSHRHYSHLLALYDLGTAGGAPGDVATMGASLDVWWEVTCKGPQAAGRVVGGNYDCGGFTQAAMAAMA